MLPTFGYGLLLLALLSALYNIGANVFVALATRRALRQNAVGAETPTGNATAGEMTRPLWQTSLLASANAATLAVWALISLAFLTLIFLFISDDFSVNYVWSHSAKAQPFIYKISAAWGGQSGSLLMWVWMLSTYGAAIALTGRRAIPHILPTALAVNNVTVAFFLSLIAFDENPFRLVEAAVPADGRGLNPLLQNYWMQIHPPTLYAGYVGCAIPFCLAMAALLHGRFDKEWLSFVRRWTLFPWMVLTVGIVMGGAWAYETLGWGGYWAWDPVENASLMPWLTATAFLHSIIIQARRGMLKNWNMVLVTLTFLLSVFGTYLTRSGVVSSVHSFAESNIGVYFLGFLGAVLFLAFSLIVWRRDLVSSATEIESPLSREGAFLLNNWILLGSAFAVLWGTVYPALSEAIGNQKVSVGASYFNSVMVPLGLVLLGLTGVGPLMAWRRTSPRALLKIFAWPLVAALVAAPGLWALAQWQTGAATSFCLAVFVTVSIVSEFIRGTRARSNMTGEGKIESFVNLIAKNKGRYGGYLVHLGIVMMFVGFAGSFGNDVKGPIALKPGQTLQIGEYTLLYKGLGRPAKGQVSAEKSDETGAIVEIKRNGQALLDNRGKPFVMQPHIDTFKQAAIVTEEARAGQPPQTARRPDIMSTFAHDLYLVLDSYDEQTQEASIKAYLNPLVMWIWLSQLFFLGGTIIAMLPNKQRVREAAAETAPREIKGGARTPITTNAATGSNAPPAGSSR